MASTLYNNIHRQQLFHWIGGHIEEKATGTKLTDDQREAYVDCLEKALEKGLWVNVPRIPDKLGNGNLISVARPITCFTEWSLGESLPHTRRYGRLGLGFPKAFVSKRGGQPVTYVRDDLAHNPFVSALEALKTFTAKLKQPNISEAERIKIEGHVEYLSHFAKKMKKEAMPTAITGSKGKKEDTKPKIKTPVSVPVRSKVKMTPDPYDRKFGTTLHFMEEREWRIVYDDSLKRHFKTGPSSGGPRHYIPFKAGKELYTIVLPDNRSVRIAIGRESLRERLYPELAPHVTILSLGDIGTF